MFTGQSLPRIQNKHTFTLELSKLPVNFGSLFYGVCERESKMQIGILGRVLFANQQTHYNLKIYSVGSSIFWHYLEFNSVEGFKMYLSKTYFYLCLRLDFYFGVLYSYHKIFVFINSCFLGMTWHTKCTDIIKYISYWFKSENSVVK